MKLDEKRQAIEALLCAGADANDVSLVTARYAVGVSYSAVWATIDGSYVESPSLLFNDRLTEVAYRLIESSPTLRREWFGAR